jgi:hypothetical protein
MSQRPAKRTDPQRVAAADEARRAAERRKAQLDLALAARSGDARALRRALDNGADPTERVAGQTPLMVAASSGRDAGACVRLLLPGSNPLATTDAGEDALMAAASAGAAEAIAILLPVSRPLRANAHGQTALALSVLHGRFSAFRLLLPASDPRQANTHGVTPLMAAACVGAQRFVSPLLAGSDLLACDNIGRDALAHAVFGDHARYLAEDAPACVRAIAEAAPLSRLTALGAGGLSLIELAQTGLGVFGGAVDDRIAEIVDILRLTIAAKERDALLGVAAEPARRDSAENPAEGAPATTRRL